MGNIVAALLDSGNPNIKKQTLDLQLYAHALGVQLNLITVNVRQDLQAIFARMRELRAAALVIGASSFFKTVSEKLAELSVRYSIPAIYRYGDFAAAGGLMSYGNNMADAHRAAGVYTARILNGEKPPGLLFQNSSRIELILNLNTARALGLAISESLLMTADEVIE